MMETFSAWSQKEMLNVQYIGEDVHDLSLHLFEEKRRAELYDKFCVIACFVGLTEIMFYVIHRN